MRADLDVLRLRADVIALRAALRDALNLERFWRERAMLTKRHAPGGSTLRARRRRHDARGGDPGGMG